MQNCGQCPPSQCVSKSALDLPNVSSPDVQSSSTSAGSKVGLIVGLTVGLVGGFLLLIVLYLCWRRRWRLRSDKQSLILPTNTSDISGHQPTLSTNSAVSTSLKLVMEGIGSPKRKKKLVELTCVLFFNHRTAPGPTRTRLRL
jgi:hypothetical protein